MCRSDQLGVLYLVDLLNIQVEGWVRDALLMTKTAAPFGPSAAVS